MEQTNLYIAEPAGLHELMRSLRYEQKMDFLESLTGMDWGERKDDDSPDALRGLGVVYHLESTETGRRAVVKCATENRENPQLPSVTDLWRGAELPEREVYDFYGITFGGHPDMRRLFLRTDWVGWPMRKDDDPAAQNPLRMDNEPTVDTTRQMEIREDGTITEEVKTLFGDEEYVVNIGPQHPATHGVLRFRVSLEGENIHKIDVNCGYIHRGIEKMNESLTYPQTLALTDRLDYLGAMQNRHALCMCIEKAMGVEVSERVQYIRTIMDELQRIDSHILFFSCLCQDLGATTAFLYGFRDREKVLDIFEETCGGRLILNYNTIGGVQADIHPNFVKRVKEFIPYMRKNLKEYHDIFTGNIIARQRLQGIGMLSREDAISFGATGGTGRASGWACDVRKRMPYAAYDKVQFKEIVRTEGDCFARYMVRMDEILESLSIIEQLIDNIPEGPYQEKMKPIIRVPEGSWYAAVEGSRGEFGVYLESRGDKTPYRLHYRSTGLPLVGAIDTITRNAKIADLIAIGGTLDYVVPDIDR
ncbi:NADH-quinone oxidoreductase subunit D [uncultured Bacteroides sp.]|uniref:NADH-quinone oxidoreductase subunit D n=1 Tax=uncultured Bacteroides sp. TaxID=162156 RepID=UPI0026277E84|nr:NADH-quinone oxidoreductase subunit D [uncultured Bacteroides sp.]